MNIRKFFLIILALTGSISIMAQLNPIKNLQFTHSYEMPYNFFELKWSPPDVSPNDTLKGYNVYRGNLLYRFQTDTTMHHKYFLDSDAPEAFLGGEGLIQPPFYIHVTAVYNAKHLESVYKDSVQCLGLALNINKIHDNNIKTEIIPNPAKDKIRISGLMNASPLINISDIKGQIIIQTTCNDSKDIDVSKLPKGIYFVRIPTNAGIVCKKLAIL